MNGTIADVIAGLTRQWGEVYVLAQENIATANEIQNQLDAMALHAEKVMRMATVCAWVGLALAVGAAGLWLWKKLRGHV